VCRPMHSSSLHSSSSLRSYRMLLQCSESTSLLSLLVISTLVCVTMVTSLGFVAVTEPWFPESLEHVVAKVVSTVSVLMDVQLHQLFQDLRMGLASVPLF